MARKKKLPTRPAGRTVRAPRKRATAKADLPILSASVDDAETQPVPGRALPAGADAFSRYMRDVGQAPPLLTKAGELELGRRLAHRAVDLIVEHLEDSAEILAAEKRQDEVRRDDECCAAEAFIGEFNPRGLKGKRLETHLLNTIFNKQEGAEILMRFVADDPEGKALIRRFVESNLRLVINQAKKYGNSLLPLDELIQEGNLGLMHAVPRFDYRRGLRFSTYATWWIRHAIGRAIADKGRTVRLPVHMIEAAHQMAKTRMQMAAALGRPPTDEELAKKLKLSVDKLDKMRRWTMMTVSLDEPVNEDREDPMGDFVSEETDEPQPWSTLIPGKDFQMLWEALSRLRGIEGDVLRLRYGLGDDQELTLREIGEKYSLSRERIRQLETQALKKLRLQLPQILKAA